MDGGHHAHQLGGRYVSFFAVEDGGKLTLFDAGLPGHWADLELLLSSGGWRLSDVDAVLLTHAHPDHLGIAERVRTEAPSPVYVHGADAALARGEITTAPPKLPFWRPYLFKLAIQGIRAGLLKVPPVVEVSTFADGESIDVPGSPRIIHTPGHTDGSCAIWVESRRLLFAGDALATVDIITGELGPRIPPAAVNADSEQALASLDNFAGIDADIMYVGHGKPWAGGVAEAVRMARAVGIY
jgi:glyoxylase-like metal-dependent hydrolase (beta-lactamase superfamily II)